MLGVLDPSLEPAPSGCYDAKTLTEYDVFPINIKQEARLHLGCNKPEEVFTEGRMKKNWSERDGLFWYGGDRMFVPTPALRLALYKQYHDNPTAGHQGSDRTLEKICRDFYWPSIREDVTRYVTSCDSCQRNKPRNSQPQGLLTPLAIPDERFTTVSIDFMTLPKSKEGFNSCFVIVDKLTKLVSLTPTKDTCTAVDTAKMFANKWCLTGRGLPKTIISDRDTRFISTFWNTLMATLGIELELTTARHQEANGQAEHVVKLTKDTLRAYVGHNGSDWPTFLPSIEFALNDSRSSATGFSPFQLAYGLSGKSINPTVAAELDRQLDTELGKAQITIAAAQDRMVRNADRDRMPARVYSAGDRVMLERDGINWPADSKADVKLLSRRLGPFSIVSVDPERNNVTLQLPHNLKVHPVFHTSLVSLYKDPASDFPTRFTSPVVGEPFDPETEFEVEKIIAHRIWRKKKQLKIRWVGYGPQHDEWTDLASCTCDDAIKLYTETRGSVTISELFMQLLRDTPARLQRRYV